MPLVELRPLLPEDTIFDLRYSTANNVIGRVLSDCSSPKLEAAAARKLLAASTFFSLKNLRMVIWDAHREPELQQTLRAFNSDDRYVLDDSNHPKGLAVDLTLATHNGTYLDMGTDFDDFSDKAHVATTDLSRLQIANRALLLKGMSDAGFTQWPYEWWHFDTVA